MPLAWGIERAAAAALEVRPAGTEGYNAASRLQQHEHRVLSVSEFHRAAGFAPRSSVNSLAQLSGPTKTSIGRTDGENYPIVPNC
jgi:hypothetical protein